MFYIHIGRVDERMAMTNIYVVRKIYQAMPDRSALTNDK